MEQDLPPETSAPPHLVTVPDKEEQMTTLAALTTPCLLLEDEKLQANMDRLARRLHERGWMSWS